MTLQQTIRTQWPKTIMIILLAALGIYSCAVTKQTLSPVRDKSIGASTSSQVK